MQDALRKRYAKPADGARAPAPRSGFAPLREGFDWWNPLASVVPGWTSPAASVMPTAVAAKLPEAVTENYAERERGSYLAMAKSKTIRSVRQGNNSDPDQLVAGTPVVHDIPSFPRSATAPWAGDSYELTFKLPKNVGKVVKAIVEFKLTLGAPADASSTLCLVDTPHWISDYSVYCGDDLIETVSSEALYSLILGTNTKQDFRAIATSMNLDMRDTSLANILTTDYRLAGEYMFYLPLAGGWLAMQPFVKGFAREWSIRLRMRPLASVAFANVAVAGSFVRAGVNRPEARLKLIEHRVSPGSELALAKAHETRIEYNGWRVRSIEHVRDLTVGNQMELDLQGLTGKIAGICVFARPLTPTVGTTLNVRAALNSVRLVGGTGESLLENVDGKYLEAFFTPWGFNTTCSSNILNGFFTYWIPLCGNLSSVLDDGTDAGGIEFQGGEKIVITPSATTANMSIFILALSYKNYTVAKNAIA